MSRSGAMRYLEDHANLLPLRQIENLDRPNAAQLQQVIREWMQADTLSSSAALDGCVNYHLSKIEYDEVARITDEWETQIGGLFGDCGQQIHPSAPEWCCHLGTTADVPYIIGLLGWHDGPPEPADAVQIHAISFVITGPYVPGLVAVAASWSPFYWADGEVQRGPGAFPVSWTTKSVTLEPESDYVGLVRFTEEELNRLPEGHIPGDVRWGPFIHMAVSRNSIVPGGEALRDCSDMNIGNTSVEMIVEFSYVTAVT